MKKIYLSALALIAGATISAQVADASFENWEAGDLVEWNTFNPAMAVGDITDGSGNTIAPATEITTGATAGNSYVRLTSFNVANSTDPTNVQNGDYGSVLSQTFVSADQYEDFKIDLNYDIKMNDTAVISIQAYNANDDLVGLGQAYLAGSQAALTTRTIVMTYVGIPAEYDIIVSSSEGQVLGGATSTITPGSWLGLDNIVIGTTIVGLAKEELDNSIVNVFPNPASDVVNFTVAGIENATVIMSSVTGQVVVNTTITNGTKQVDVSKLRTGIYIYTVSNQNGEVLKTSKLVISK